MLKKAGHILIILLLLFSTTGLTITRHYCAKNLIQTSIFSSPANCCKGNCPGCHNEKITFRVTDQFESYQTQIDFTAGFKTLLELHSLPTVLSFSNTSNVALLCEELGDHCIKRSQTTPICAGHSTSFLQVFLF